MHDFVKKLNKIRDANPSLYRGTFSNTLVGNVLFNCKWDESTQNKVVYAANLDEHSNTVQYTVGGTKMTDLITGAVFEGKGGVYTITFDGLDCGLFLVE